MNHCVNNLRFLIATTNQQPVLPDLQPSLLIAAARRTSKLNKPLVATEGRSTVADRLGRRTGLRRGSLAGAGPALGGAA